MNEEKSILDLIKETKENKLLKLDLSKSERDSEKLPKELFELEHLEELIINGFELETISEDFLKLTHIKELHLIRTDLKKIPETFLHFKSLKNLHISTSDISEAPEFLNDWTTLEYLNLSGCRSLTRIIGLPPNLTYLRIGETGLKTIPKKVFDLKTIRKLVADKLNLKNLPIELFSMSSLASLFIGGNKLRAIPKEINQLTKLIELWIEDNLFTEVPKEILSLTQLERLNLNANKISKLTTGFVKLKQLKTLDLGNNELERIPSQIFKIENLKSLRLGNYGIYPNTSSNRIKKIPKDLLNLKKLQELVLYHNPIENVPQEILNDGINAIKNFLQSKLEAENEEFLYEAKMVIVGRGNVGKTVLTKKLTLPTYSLSKSETTVGISILKNPFYFKTPDLHKTDTFKFNIWDFGGQEKYDATHQLFITSRSVYLFLTEARDESNYLDFYYWLNTIKLFSTNNPVIVVLSKYDERKKLLPESIYKEKFQNIIDFIDVSCADGYEFTLENLKEAIRKAIHSLPQTKQKLSNRWIDIRNRLEILSISKDYITYDEYLTVCRKYRLDKQRADFLSQFLNDLGVIIHRQNDLLLRKTVFIKTDWAVDGMYKVVDAEKLFNNKGRFTNADLAEIWNERRFAKKQPELLKLMEYYNLCFELKDGSGYIAPDSLPPDKPKGLSWNNTQNLHFEYKYEFMPAGMLSRFIVKSHSFIKDELYWKYGVVLEYENTLALVEEDYINGKIKISLKGENKKGLLSAVRIFIKEIHRDFNKTNSLVFEEMIPCNCSVCRMNKTPHFFKFSVLRNFEKNAVQVIPCDISAQPVKVKSLISDIQTPKHSEYLLTNTDLKNFILDIINNSLEKDIIHKEGYVNFWRDQHFTLPKNEVEVQPYISNFLDNYCKINGIQLSREVRESNGSVDILFSYTNQNKEILKTCLEIKKAHHQDITTAIKSQLPDYMISAGTEAGIYLVIWFKSNHFKSPEKYGSMEDLSASIEKNNSAKDNVSVKILDCTKKMSPSKRKS